QIDAPILENEENQEVLETVTVVQPVRRSSRESRQPDRYLGYLITDGEILLLECNEPTTYNEALTGPDSDKWLEAMR
ncbi:hypothetical protein Q6294_34560, partial [Klebsiella pneumoniae]